MEAQIDGPVLQRGHGQPHALDAAAILAGREALTTEADARPDLKRKVVVDTRRKPTGLGKLRDRAVVALLGYGGLRRSEVVALDIGDYDSKLGLRRVKGKGEQEAAVALPQVGPQGWPMPRIRTAPSMVESLRVRPPGLFSDLGLARSAPRGRGGPRA